MRTYGIALSGLLLSAAAIAPAHANWFSEGFFGHRNVASAPNPTPEDLRVIGDSNIDPGPDFYFDRRDGHWHAGIPSDIRYREFRDDRGVYSENLSQNFSDDDDYFYRHDYDVSELE